MATARTGAKPTLVDALAGTWRSSAEHLAEQLSRFVRLTVLAAIPSIWTLVQGDKFDWHILLAFILPFAELAWRQVFPALSPKRVNSANGATIVPAEVGLAVPVKKTTVKRAAKKTTHRRT